MLSRIRRGARPRSCFNFESLESRTLLSSATSTLAEAMFQTSYAALSTRPALKTSS